MSVPVYCELFFTYGLWLLFLSINCIYTILRNLYWRINGTHARILENCKPHNYGGCAHVLTIIFSHRLDEFIGAGESDFVLVHERFDRPEYVLRDDVTLYTITETEAIFVQSKKETKQPAHESDFYILGQYRSAERIIKIPLNHFTVLAERMEGDGAKIIILQAMARCGGTLLAKIFKGTGRCIAFCEPHSFNAIVKHLYATHIWTGAKARRLFKNVVRMICKPYRGLADKPLAYIIKPNSTSVLSSQMVHDSMPDVLQFFMYRDPLAIAKSLRRIAELIPMLKIGFYLPKIPRATAPSLLICGYAELDFRGWTPCISLDLELGYRAACSCMYRIQMTRKNGVDIPCLRYRDLVKHPDQMIKQIFDICGIPENLISKAKVVLDKDSQANSSISRNKVNRAMPIHPVITPEFIQVACDMSEEFGVPYPDEFKDELFHLPGSLIPSKTG